LYCICDYKSKGFTLFLVEDYYVSLYLCGDFYSVVIVAVAPTCDKYSSSNISCGKMQKPIRNEKFKIGQVKDKEFFTLKSMHFNQHHNQTNRNFYYCASILKLLLICGDWRTMV
ncbi:hypothetical protein T4B_7401, partial [Trichinella pseudospiralis]